MDRTRNPIPSELDPLVDAAPGVWVPAQRAMARLVSPLQRFLAIEAASGLLLMAATAIALVWANSPWRDSYHHLWEAPIGFQVAGWSFVRPLHFWVNDGLMTIFFFVVGLEIRREAYEGELADLRRAALPIAAALGGMLIPAAVYAALNVGRAGSSGWAIPMATDIAFAVGVLTLFGSRVPGSLRVLLLALAVIDDIGAIIVIAIFYNQGGTLDGLLVATTALVVVVGLRTAGVRAPLLYVIPGAALWAGLYGAGVHPTVAGVILGLLAPVRPWFGASGFARTTQEHLDQIDEATDRTALNEKLRQIETARREAISPADRLEHLLNPWVAFAGAELTGDGLFIFLGIVLGLAAGKPLGILAASAIATRSGLASRGSGVTHSGVALVGMVGGIGFTMSLFVAQLAFPPGPLLDTAKLGVLVASAVAAAVGAVFGLLTLRGPR